MPWRFLSPPGGKVASPNFILSFLLISLSLTFLGRIVVLDVMIRDDFGIDFAMQFESLLS
jgi:hypothetical protein